MNLKAKTRRELSKIQSEVDAVIRVGFSKSLWHVSKLDQCRLVRLKVWEERYSVRLMYILGCLLPWSWSRMPKHAQDKAKNGKGLGTKIAVITSNGAERFLREQVSRDFPDKENVSSLHDEQRDAILRLINDEEIHKPKKVLQYPTIQQFVDSYQHKIIAKKKAMNIAQRKLSKMPYRSNPFR